jgi:general secretion pathway protein E
MTAPPQFPKPHEPYDGSAEDAPVTKLWYGILTECLKRSYEQIHVAPKTATSFVVRRSSKGEWEEMISPPVQMYPAFLQRLKVMASLNLARRLQLEEGVFRLAVGGSIYDLKVTKRVRPDGQEEAMIDLPAGPVNTASAEA